MSLQFASKLSSRGLVEVSGKDSVRFLQGLVTCDVHNICGPERPRASAAAFLNGRGRVLFGTLLYRKHNNCYLIDLERSLIPDLLNHLKQYKLRARVDLEDVSKQYNVWSVVNGSSSGLDDLFDVWGKVFDDPRLPALGKRAIVDRLFNPKDENIHAEESYTELRILNGVPDGPDFRKTPLPLDLALHLLNGVSFSKGCYLGQELTARSHFTGVLRKRITPLAVCDDADAVGTEGGAGLVSDDERLKLRVGAQLFAEGTERVVGEVSSASRNIGLGVLRLAESFDNADGRLRLRDGRAVTAWRPTWWRGPREQRERAVRADGAR